jgi:DNA-binding YbaB/EbfC family protein
MTEVLALAQEQIANIAAVQKKQAELTATGAAADGLVEVTVNANGHVIKTAIDESYLDDYEFEELADHITSAAQDAVRTVGDRVAELMAPITDRRKLFPSLADVFEGAPDLRDLTPPVFEPSESGRSRPDPDQGHGTETGFPTVRR